MQKEAKSTEQTRFEAESRRGYNLDFKPFSYNLADRTSSITRNTRIIALVHAYHPNCADKTPMTVNSADHTIYQPSILSRSQVLKRTTILMNPHLLWACRFIMDRTDFECGELVRIYNNRKSAVCNNLFGYMI